MKYSRCRTQFAVEYFESEGNTISLSDSTVLSWQKCQLEETFCMCVEIVTVCLSLSVSVCRRDMCGSAAPISFFSSLQFIPAVEPSDTFGRGWWPSSGEKNKFGRFLVVVQLIHRLTQADSSCTTMGHFFPPLADDGHRCRCGTEHSP